MPPHIRGTLAEKKRRPAGHTDHGACMMQRITVDHDYGHRGVPSPVERLCAAFVGPKVRGKRSP
jgi:hypothetical protein